MTRYLRCATAAVCFGVCGALVLGPASVWASALLAPAVGAADSATMGTRIADPHTPSSALFENPAGLTGFDSITGSAGAGVAYGRVRVQASAPAGYGDSDDVLTLVPDMGLSIPYGDRWRFALGAYGTTGSRFDFEGDPALGVGDFFSETILLAFPLGVAYRLSDRVSIGAEIQPLFGQLRTHFPLAGIDFRYKINGPGVQGMAGLTVRPSEQWALGLGVRTPGRVWMSGSMPVPGLGRQDVDVDVELPTQVLLGATWYCTRRLTLSSSLRFTDSSTLGDSTIEYELTPQANVGFVPDGKDEWKFALAAEYELRRDLMLRFGVSWASNIVGSGGVSPVVFDGDDAKIAVGVGKRFGHWVFDLTAGYALPAKRQISAQQALILPGKYSMQGAIVLLELTYER